MNSLELNDGWTQIPPKEDGEYWMAYAKPWHEEDAYDQCNLLLVRIDGGKRSGFMENCSKQWMPPECDDPSNPVWDSESQFEMLAVWRSKLNGEDFDHLPPKIKGRVYERHPKKCPACGGKAAIYRGDNANLFVCFECCKEGSVQRDYFERVFQENLISTIEQDEKVNQR